MEVEAKIIAASGGYSAADLLSKTRSRGYEGFNGRSPPPVSESGSPGGRGDAVLGAGKSVGNGYAESFHNRLRDEFLVSEEFENLPTARKLSAAWKDDYNHHRPHGSLGYVTPAEFAARLAASAPASATPQATFQQHS